MACAYMHVYILYMDRVEVCRVYNTSLYTMFRLRYCTEPSALICWSFVKTVMVLNDRARDNATYNIRAQTSGQLNASDPIRPTHENIAIYCGELPAANCLFFVKKTKDNRTWVADQEPVNMKRLEP